jgi:tetratricopeptide (TPR) repeat protein
MSFTGVSEVKDLFVVANQQAYQLESLANSALSRGMNLHIKQDYEGAIEEFQRSIGLAPTSDFAVVSAHYMASAYLQLNDTKGAAEAYETAINLDPNRDDSHVKLGNLYFSEGRFKEAEQEYKEAVRLFPSANNHYSLGQAYLSQELYNDAENQFNEVIRLEPESPNGYFGKAQALSNKGLYQDAIYKFQKALQHDRQLYDAYAEIGYAYADMGEMDQAQQTLDFLETKDPLLADSLSRYMYKVDPPKMMYARSTGNFLYLMPNRTQVSVLDEYLENADAEKTFKMIFQFDKQMDRESIENKFNWNITRAIGAGPGQAYNYGFPVPETEAKIALFPEHVYYNSEDLTATVYFKIKQNADANATIDPAHIEFKFIGKDAFGFSINPDFDQFTGFSGSA